MRKRAVVLIACVGLVVGMLIFMVSGPAKYVMLAEGEEVHGVWLAYVDFASLGLYNKSETEFEDNAQRFFDAAKKNDINVVFFQVRMFDDAGWKSDNFKISKYIWDKKSEIPYDPLEIMVELAHRNGMEIHAWMNPYRISHELILDPALETTNERILSAVSEVAEGYRVNGIHFDDYFYQNALSSGKSTDEVSTAEKKSNVNEMVSQVYQRVKEIDPQKKFGISPQGNAGNCSEIGADVETWLSSKTTKYIDYLIPQIYWTDQHTATWRERMFTDSLKEWKTLNKNDTILYVGLASYQAGVVDTVDPGWGKRSDNLASQLKILRAQGCAGYSLFSAKEFFRGDAKEELSNLLKDDE